MITDARDALRLKWPAQYEALCLEERGMKQEAIAKVLGLQQAAVSRRLNRAHSFLLTFTAMREAPPPTLTTIAEMAGLTRKQLLLEIARNLTVAELVDALKDIGGKG